MQKLQFIRRVIIRGTLALAISVSPALSLNGAQLVSADGTDCTAPDDSSYGAGVHHPVGADAGTFTYNCDSDTWTNQYYTYHPAANSRTVNYARDYSYDCAAGKWYMTQYDYSAGDSAYHKNRVVTSDPGLPTNCPVAPSAPTPSGSSTPASSGSGGGNGNSSSIASTGPGSSNSATTTSGITIGSNNTNNLSMNNGIHSQASTGNAGVLYNTSGGDAGTGGAESLANIANVLQSSANVFGPDTATFTANINGDVNGDFMFDPSAVMNTGPGSNNSANTTGNLTVNQANNTDASINNNIDVGANTGDATVASNTKGGNATSGNANAIVDLMNVINSTVAAGKSFVGTVNINGNLNGDILLPQGLLDQLLASSGPNSTNTESNNLNVGITDTNNTTSNILNDINANADSGNATVAGNTQGGAAKSGSAKTNLTLLNLTGSSVVGANDLLVFVNVLGHWVGMIMNAPAGSTAASLGGGITSTGPNSSNALNHTGTLTANSTNNSNLGITNHVNAHSQTGDASVLGNTLGGDATSGDANTAVNVLNVANSNLNLSNWFGILFINVFGNWVGSFGVNTSAGDPTTTGGNATGSAADASVPMAQFATFVARSTGGHGATPHHGSAATAPVQTQTIASVLGASTAAKKVSSKDAPTSLPTPDNASHASYVLPIVGFGVAAILLAVSERDRFFGKKH